MTDTILEVRDLSIEFGGLKALDRISLDVARGEILGLIGPNGAGKTSLFNCLSGFYRPHGGEIRFIGNPLVDRSPHEIAALGIGRTFQNLALFPSLSVLDNVLVGGHARSRAGFLASALGLPKVIVEENAARQRGSAILEELDLSGRADARVSTLPFATRKRVELARSLMLAPALLLLDEPAGGLNSAEVDELIGLLIGIRARHALTIVLVEHNIPFIMSIADRVAVLDFGRKIAEGAPSAVRNTPAVIDAYLGLSPA